MKCYKNKYIISDLHLGHKNIIKYEDRPFESIQEMNKSIVRNWNSIVKSDDLVYLLGDVSMGLTKDELKSILYKLNGDIILIMGNHDKKPSGYGYNWFKSIGRFYMISEFPIIVDNWIILSHEPVYIGKNSPYINIHGHVHGDDKYKTISSSSACVCVERWNYYPIEINSLLNKIQGLREAV